MATYIVFTRESTRDASELETYSQNVGPTLAGHRSRCSPPTAVTRCWKAPTWKVW